MKKSLYIALVLVFISAVWYGCKDKIELPGELHGVVTDKATGEPIKTAGVELQPIGLKTVTGTDGQYGFNEIEPGKYKLYITKTGYADWLSNEIVVKSEQIAQGDVQLEKLPPALRIVNDKQEDIDELDFGAALADVLRSFNIFNDGSQTLDWEITNTADWIVAISKARGTLGAGATQAVGLTIDRDKLKGGDNVTTMLITSNDGSKQLKVKAVGEKRSLPVLNTLDATEVKMTSAVFHGVLTDTGTPSYTERGFVYGLSSMPTIENTIGKLTVAVTADKAFQATATGLEANQTYYVRAYAINKAGTAYSTNEVRCEPKKVLAVVKTDAVTNKSISGGRATLNGTIADIGEPVYTERGFVYSTAHNPMVEDATKKSVTGSGTGKFSVNLTDLIMGAVYYVRGYATNEIGTAYGEEVELDFKAILPVVQTKPVTNKSIANGTARFNAVITAQGDPAFTERGFVYGEQHEPNMEQGNKRIVSGGSLGDFTTDITELEMGKTYYVRAYAKTEYTTVYGNEVELDFNAVLPVVNTGEVTDIDGASATLNATVESVGDPIYTEAGFVYGTMPNPTLEEEDVVIEIVKGTGIGSFKKEIENLVTGSIYYVRAYLRNENCIAYGDVVSFKAESAVYMIVPGCKLMVQKEDLGFVKQWSTAESMCKNSTLGGFTDWRLPTKDELMMLYNNRYSIGGFNMQEAYKKEYWSSTPCSSGYNAIFFSNGSIACHSNTVGYGCSVRAVRTITEE